MVRRMPTARRRPLPYRVRVLFHDRVVAESDDVVRVDVLDGPPELWFPRKHVAGVPATGEGTDLWRTRTRDPIELVAFEHADVRLEIVDGEPGDDDRDVTTVRFPNWGDAADLIEVIDVQPDGERRYRSEPRSDWRRPVVEGSQILGQSIVAASRHAPGRRVVAASMVFTRAADARAPYAIGLDEVAAGRTFTALRVEATQDGRTCAFGSLLLDVTAPDVVRHADPAPDVPGPYDSVPVDMSVTGRDVRVVDGAYTGDPGAPVGPPELAVWVRFRRVPDDQPVHAGLLAQFTGHMSIAAALRPHAGIGQDQAHRTLSTAINAISLSFHEEVRADRWMLYHHRSTVASQGMTHSECRVHDEDGAHIASFTVDAMVRAFGDPSPPVDDRTAL
jgi:acyl-CoA thioesterase